MTVRFYLGAEYALGYELLSVCSLEDRLIPEAIFARTAARGSLLDIGCGDGRITEAIATQFSAVTVVEPNPLLFSLAMARLGQRAYCLHGTHDEQSEYGGPFDLILVSHMLYHVEVREWRQLFGRLARRLTAQGEVAVILWDSDSAARQLTIARAPDRWLCSIEDLLDARAEIEATGLCAQAIYTFVPIIQPKTMAAARLILRFLLGRSAAHVADPSIEAECLEMMNVGLPNKQTLVVFRRI